MSSEKYAFLESVSVLGKEYRIQLVDTVDADGSRGECNIKTKQIKVKKGKACEKWSVLFHELAHAWLEESKMTAVIRDEDMEELLVMMIEEQFLPMVFELVGRRQLLPK